MSRRINFRSGNLGVIVNLAILNSQIDNRHRQSDISSGQIPETLFCSDLKNPSKIANSKMDFTMNWRANLKRKKYLPSDFAALWLLWRLCFESYLTPSASSKFFSGKIFLGCKGQNRKRKFELVIAYDFALMLFLIKLV